jgi:hypothetical protein
MSWNATSIAAILIATSSVAAAEPPLVPGHYKLIEPANGIQAMEVTTAAADSSGVLMHSTITRSSCSGTVEVRLEYALPVNYRGETVKYANGSCSGVLTCPGFIFKCNGVGPAPAGFSQVRKDTVTSTSTFWGGSATYKSGTPIPNSANPDSSRAVGLYKTNSVHHREKGGVLVGIKTTH